jgi:hypothetical protein
LTIFGDTIDAEVTAAEALRDERHSAAADKGIEDDALGGATSPNAGFDERFRKNGEVGVAKFG